MKSQKTFVLSLGMLALCFTACGDSGDGGTIQSFAGGVESFDDLPACSKNREADTILVVEDSLTYVCTNGKWNVKKYVIDTVKTEDDLPACSKAIEGDSAYVSGEYAVYVCSESIWEKVQLVMNSYGSLDNMPNCTKRLTGVDAISTLDSAVYLCDSERWILVATVYGSDRDLPNCTENRDGKQVYLKGTSEKYICSDKKWSAIEEWVGYSGKQENSEPSSGNSSESKEEDDSGSSVRKEDSSSSLDENLSSSSALDDISSNTESAWCGEVEYDADSSFCDIRDMHIYKYVTIGTQVWMAENLNYAYTGVRFKYRVYTFEGHRDVISDSTSWCYDNDFTNCAKYGRLYTWAAAMDSVGEWSTDGRGCGDYGDCSPIYPVRGICPEGWHLPHVAELNTLIDAVGGEYLAGFALKSQSGWNSDEGRAGEDAFGFSALPAGNWNGYHGSFDYEGTNAYFWSSTAGGGSQNDKAYGMNLNYSDDKASLLNSLNNRDGYSIRCLRDN